MKHNDTIDSFLSLVRLGIGHDAPLPKAIDWKAMKALSYRQGLSAVVWDGVRSLRERGQLAAEIAPDEVVEKEWSEYVAESYERRYADYMKRIGQLAWFYNQHGYKLMILKGYGLSLNYPNPSHRPCGDIDIWAFGKYKEADEALHSEFGIKIDDSHHHHTVFNFMGYMVENHYDLLNVHTHRSNAEMEKIFKDLAMDDSNRILIENQPAYLPTPNLNALFLLRHSMAHFAAVNMNLRQLLDWAFFVKAHTAEVDWGWLQGVLRRFHMSDLFMCLNYICVHDLGFPEEIFPPIDSNLTSGGVLPELSGRILADILYPEFSEKQPSGLLPRVLFKYRRWKANTWKHRLCYKEGMFSSFFVSAWAHLLKPRSI